MSDDEDSTSDDFLLFKWDDIDTTDDTDAKCNNKDDSIDIHEELSRLSDEAGYTLYCGSDLHLVVKLIGSSFPHERRQDENQEDDDVSINFNCRCIICNIIDMRQKESAIKQNMGTMAQCRGSGGEKLREAGAISSLLSVLWRLIVPLPLIQDKTINSAQHEILLPRMSCEYDDNDESDTIFDMKELCNNHIYLQNSESNSTTNFDDIILNEFDMTTLDLATTCLGSLRDLACGSAENRSALLSWIPPPNNSLSHDDQCIIENGVHVICAYINRYHQMTWEDIISLKQRGSAEPNTTLYTYRGKTELRLITNALGVTRNSSHSTPVICQAYFNHKIVDALVWHIMPHTQDDVDILSSSSLPDVSCPWREACFRIGASLINIAEKCKDAGHQIARNRRLIYLLIETWGGLEAINLNNPTNSKINKVSSLPVLHLGLLSILNAAESGVLEGGLDDVMKQVLEKEKLRKIAAQRREEERKRQQKKQKEKSSARQYMDIGFKLLLPTCHLERPPISTK